MTQKALCRFSASLLKTSDISIQGHLLLLMLMYGIYAGIILTGAWFAVHGGFTGILLFCGARLLLRTLLAVLSAGKRGDVIEGCLGMLSVDCADRKVRNKRLRRLYALRGLWRFGLRLLFAGIIVGGCVLAWLASRQAEGVYLLLGAAQAVPLLLAVMIWRFRMETAFAASETLCVYNESTTSWDCLKGGLSMMRGQYLFAAGTLLRRGLWMLLPVTQPRFVVTMEAFFVARRLEQECM